jgi:hypothetical protein
MLGVYVSHPGGKIYKKHDSKELKELLVKFCMENYSVDR